MDTDFFYTILPHRGLIHIEGADAGDFLQNLITNDIHKLDNAQILYACLLNAQGKFLHDFFVHRGDGFFLLDCEGGERAKDLYNRLNMYRLRADVRLSVEENVPVYAGFFDGGFPDPRHPDMGHRAFEKPDGAKDVSFDIWDKQRIRLCVPDGSRDMIVGTSTMDEARLDALNGVDYSKGCYVGQELTARMHYRGLGKKHLYAVQGHVLPESGAAIKNAAGVTIGEMRSRCGDIGLALLKDAEIEGLDKIKILK